MTRRAPDRFRRACLAAFGVAWLALAIAPTDRTTWALENLPTVPLVAWAAWRGDRLGWSRRAWVQATAFALLHTVGSHWTYSLVPAGAWLRAHLDLARNPYDRIVHFAFGLLMLRPLRELVVPPSMVRRPARAAVLAVSLVASCSLLYEILEWLVAAIVDPSSGLAFVGAQGDPWDAEKDMGLALLGALMAALLERRKPTRSPAPPDG